MFNLVGKRYLFLIISLIIIIPGVISLLSKGMNVGIDFAGGATVELRPSVNISLTDVRTLLKPLNLANLQVINGNNVALSGDSVAWVRLNTWVDDNVKSTITKALQDKYGQSLVVQFQDLPLSGKKTTVVVITKFSGVHSSSDIHTLTQPIRLSLLPRRFLHPWWASRLQLVPARVRLSPRLQRRRLLHLLPHQRQRQHLPPIPLTWRSRSSLCRQDKRLARSVC